MIILLGVLVPGELAAQSDEEALTESTAGDPAPPAVAHPEEVAVAPASVGDPHASLTALAAIEEAVERLVQLEVSLASAGTPGGAAARQELATVRSRLRDALVAVGQLQGEQDLREWLRAEGLVAPSARVDPLEGAGAEAEVATGALADAELRGLATTIEAAPFNEGKLQALREGLEGRLVSSDQASRLLELFSFSRDRVDALVFLHPRIADRENFGVLLSALKFESDRKAVRDRLGLGG